MRPILEINNISKKFNINVETQPYLSIRDRIAQTFTGKNRGVKDEFWALNDVSFDVYPSDCVGIIGKNGAGKSTLLKILSKITPPTSGRITSRGRIASLLEVGTGFHLELTGRENVFMNGSILGMKRKEIQRNFDAIVDFSGVSKFIDTPLKHYSSGMQLRLAFAVAAFLELEIMIIDEVLAVGDADFQRKCIGKMEDVSKSGRTILFVSHNISSLQSLCNKGVLLNNGRVQVIGDLNNVVNEYLSSSTDNRAKTVYTPPLGDSFAKLNSVELVNEEGDSITSVRLNQGFVIRFCYTVNNFVNGPLVPNIHVKTIKGDYAFVSVMPKSQATNELGLIETTVYVPSNLLNAEIYTVGVALSTFAPTTVHFFDLQALTFEVIEDVSERGFDFLQKLPGVVRPKLSWEKRLLN